MLFLLTNYSIFLELENGCYIQITGPNIGNKKRPIEDLDRSFKAIVLNDLDVVKLSNTNIISKVYFSHQIMLFSSPTYNKYGELWYGLPKDRKYQNIFNYFLDIYNNLNFILLDILNVAKYSNDNVSKTNTVMNHIFPRQFGLKNAFTNREVLPHVLYNIYMDRKNEFNVSILIKNNLLIIII